MPIRERRHRLPKNLYKGKTVVAITACIKDRKTPFTNGEIVNIIKDFLFEASDKFLCKVLCFCFMPDHLHFVLLGETKGSNCLQATHLFKQKSGYLFSKNGFFFRWQKDFYDHILRKDEDLIKQIRYIMENPVRKGLATNWKNYPYSWSKYDL
jgi:REP element-mobilizing transposase RayT